jgi:hypothetical protein
MSSSRKLDAVSQVRMMRSEREALDNWRRRQPEIPTRPAAICEAIRRLVADERPDFARSPRRTAA